MKKDLKEFFRKGLTIKEAKERVFSLQKKGYEYTLISPSGSFLLTPSGRELSTKFLDNFIYNTKLEIGNQEHVENLEAFEFAFLYNVLGLQYEDFFEHHF